MVETQTLRELTGLGIFTISVIWSIIWMQTLGAPHRRLIELIPKKLKPTMHPLDFCDVMVVTIFFVLILWVLLQIVLSVAG